MRGTIMFEIGQGNALFNVIREDGHQLTVFSTDSNVCEFSDHLQVVADVPTDGSAEVYLFRLAYFLGYTITPQQER